MDILIIISAKYLLFMAVLGAIIYVMRQPMKTRKEIFAFAIISLPIIYITAKISSLFYFDPRPFVVGNFIPLIPHAPDNGFPSDHTLLAGAVAGIIFFYNKKSAAILFLVAFIIGFSRVLAGVHHTVDIFGSIVIASAVSGVVYRFVMPIVRRSKLYKKYLA